MKNMTLLLITCLAFISWSVQAQHLEIEHNSHSSTRNPHILLKETQAGDFARIRLESDSNSPNFWEIAGRTGSNNNLNFYYDSDGLSGNYLSIFGASKLIRVGSSDTGVNLEVFGATDVTGNLNVDGVTDLNETNIVGTLDVSGDIDAGEHLTLDPPSNGDAKITLEGGINTEAIIEFKEDSGSEGNNVDLEIRNNSGAGSTEFYTGSGMNTRMAISSAGNITVGTTASSGNIFAVGGSAGKTVGGGAWNTISDVRLKKDVHNFKEGLEVLMKIRPVWFKYNGKVGTNPNHQEVGILAQEMQEIAPYMISEFEHKVEKTDKVEKYLTYNSNALQYILVNAIQEQQKELDEKSSLIETQNEEITALKNRLDRIEKLLLKDELKPTSQGQNAEIDAANLPRLEQNAPNPFNGQTQIQYFVPSLAQQAQINVYDQNGKMLKSFPLAQKGTGQLNLNMKNFANGIYSYSLQIDGQVIETKQMIQTVR